MARTKKITPSVKSNPPPAPTLSQQTNTHLELIRRKYLLQNKSLAKSNSVMLTKIANLETKISALITENMDLRQQKTAQSRDSNKQWLDEKLTTIENGVYTKFEEISQMFQNIRHNEGLAERETDGESRSHRVIHRASPEHSGRRRSSGRRQSLVFDDIPNLDESIDDSLVSTRSHRIQEPQNGESVPQRHDKVFHNAVSESETRVCEKEEEPSSYEISDYMIPECDEEEVQSVEITLAPTPKTPLPTVTASNGFKKNTFDPLLFPSTDRSFTVYSDDIEEGEAEEVAESEAVLHNRLKHSKPSKPKSLPKSEEAMPRPQSVVEESTTPRRGRERKQVNYALPSLRAKMRRPTAKLVDAVVEAPKEEYQGLIIPAYKGNQAPDINTVEATTRKPLRDVSRATNLKTKRRLKIHDPIAEGLNTKTDDPDSKRQLIDETLERMREASRGVEEPSESASSVFDFVDDPTKLYVDTSRSSIAKKRGSSFGAKREKRRHSMIL
ncbi:hypothetical protein BABINDRAFT_160531 [Babjeviella inositovora NRRL Y-12698]|uniref:Shugoshin C-terminal domain-containing protein n=1 Tax=Babjeviella inositovora NRRL Y-12698 TaxID=984486 RepID=A0A1E3QTZ6_9ASCO|nr:uncharacterized protein BABINDRAFT_160531 [Babjeviella inositovora NRRL Y-12698]ODQ81129.1 hypothetical protein BABINDRAFT_160531 [Babjeviella inositovora NRRL Y-12698]